MNKTQEGVIFIHRTIVPRDNSVGKLLITDDNIISLLQNKCFSFSKVLSSVTCNISTYMVKVSTSRCKYHRLLTAYYSNGGVFGAFHKICICNPMEYIHFR